MTIFYSVLFSLGEPKQNQYCYLPLLQYKALRATKTLKEGDKYVLIADDGSADYLRSSPGMATATIIRVPKPPTLLEGMGLRYFFPRLMDLSGQVAVYLDLDMLPIGAVDFDVSPDTLLVYPEGKPTDSNYCGDFQLSLPYGLSSGFFAFRDGPRVRDFFTRVLGRLAQKGVGKPYYTLDQPFFNDEVAKSPKGFARAIDPKIVSFNGQTNHRTARFVNLCGDPGDGPLHFQKVLEFFVLAFLRQP